ncbi:MAG TPA: MFS transporter, partial [Rhodospirillales bacterium]|nr:MFS transporter [Rhodospirillales bacterium]
SLIPGTTLVARWFSRRRAIALAIASSGLSVGGIVITPFAAALIDNRGLAEATPLLAIIYIVAVVPVTALMLRKSPASMGQEPDGVPTLSTNSKIHLAGTVFSVALKSRFFILATTAFIFIFMAQVGGLAHQFNLVAGRIDTTIAATSVASLAAASMIGRFIGGWAIGRFSIRPVTVALIFLQASSLIAIAYAETTASLLIASATLGLALGNLLMALPLLLADAFGMRDYGRIYSTSQAIAQLGVAMGPALVGYMYGVWNGYTLAIVVISGLALTGAAVFMAAGPVPEPGKD